MIERLGAGSEALLKKEARDEASEEEMHDGVFRASDIAGSQLIRKELLVDHWELLHLGNVAECGRVLRVQIAIEIPGRVHKRVECVAISLRMRVATVRAGNCLPVVVSYTSKRATSLRCSGDMASDPHIFDTSPSRIAGRRTGRS